jgi:CheY-like chemotaxis protein
LAGELAQSQKALEAVAQERQSEQSASRSQIEKLSAELQQSQARVESLSGDQNSLQQKLDDLSKTHDAAAQESARLAGELDKAQKTVETLAKERDGLGLKNEILSSQLEQSEQTGKTASARIDALTQTLDAARQSGEESARQLQEAQTSIETLKGNQSGLQQKLDELAKTHAATLQERERLAGELTEAQSRFDAAAQERDAAHQKNDELATTLAEIRNQIGALETQLASATQAHQEVLLKAGSAQTENDRLRQQLSTAESAAAEWSAKFEEESRRASTYAAAQAEVKTVREQLSVAQNQIATILRERNALQISAADAAIQLNEAQRRIDELMSDRMQRPNHEAPAASVQEPAAPFVPPAPLAFAEPPPAIAAPQELPQPPPLSLHREAPLVPAPEPEPEPATPSLIEIAKPKILKPQSTLRMPRLDNSTTIKFEVDSLQLKQIIEAAPEALNGMRRCLHAFIKNQQETSLLTELISSLHNLTEQTRKARLTVVHTMSFALEALINDLLNIPGQINPSTLRTVSQSIDFLVTLLDEKNLARTKDPYLANIFAVDDDADTRKTIRSAIELVNLKVTCAEDPKTTLAILGEQKFDLIFIDVGLPEMNGFELCVRLRKIPEYKKTPIVFITGAVTVQNRVQSSLSGGNDFIAKPFNLLELGVKALTWIFKGQLEIL